MSLAKTIMVQGTASSVGKSILVTALCRILRQEGYSVAPFKAQNMSLNSFVTSEGGEIGRAQAVQAEASGIEPTVDMNPVLLKPEGHARSQVIVLGKVWKTLDAADYWGDKKALFGVVAESLHRLRARHDIVVIEGAGSPAEINLKAHDLVNMHVALLAGAPVLLVGDIDRGGVFASLVGTLQLLSERERAHVKGLVINKFRGDYSLLRPGVAQLEELTGKPCLGVVPYVDRLDIAQEDSVYLEENSHRERPGATIDIAIVHLPHISNYDDFDALDQGNSSTRYVASPVELGSPDLIVLPGTKTTVADLAYLHRSGLAGAVLAAHARGVPVIGICGGYQMMGTRILDPHRVESPEGEAKGLGIFEAETIFGPEKRTTRVKAKVLPGNGLLKGSEGLLVEGYEIHMGQTRNCSGTAAFQVVESLESRRATYPEGCINNSGTALGTYIHGLFNNMDFTTNLLQGVSTGGINVNRPYAGNRQKSYDRLADVVRHSTGIKEIQQIISEGMPGA